MNLLVYAYPIYKAIVFKPLAHEIKYDDFVKNRDGIYDDNGIMCGTNDEKWYFKFLRIAAIIIPYVNALALWLLPSLLGGFVYMIVLAALDFIAGYMAIVIFREWYDNYQMYHLRFKKDNWSIPYTWLKNFMQRNNIK